VHHCDKVFKHKQYTTALHLLNYMYT